MGTSCAGTGTDNQEVRCIVVVGLPYSVEQLLQWAGRCRFNGTVHVLVTEYSLREETELASKRLGFCPSSVVKCSHDFHYVVCQMQYLHSLHRNY